MKPAGSGNRRSTVGSCTNMTRQVEVRAVGCLAGTGSVGSSALISVSKRVASTSANKSHSPRSTRWRTSDGVQPGSTAAEPVEMPLSTAESRTTQASSLALDRGPTTVMPLEVSRSAESCFACRSERARRRRLAARTSKRGSRSGPDMGAPEALVDASVRSHFHPVQLSMNGTRDAIGSFGHGRLPTNQGSRKPTPRDRSAVSAKHHFEGTRERVRRAEHDLAVLRGHELGAPGVPKPVHPGLVFQRAPKGSAVREEILCRGPR